MKNITYTCEICLGVLKEINKKSVRPFVGFEFGQGNHLRIEHFNHTERHMCMKCLEELYDIFVLVKDKKNTYNMDV